MKGSVLGFKCSLAQDFNNRQQKNALKFATLTPRVALTLGCQILVPAVRCAIDMIPVGGKSWSNKEAYKAMKAEELPINAMWTAYEAKDMRRFQAACADVGKGRGPGIKCLRRADYTQGS